MVEEKNNQEYVELIEEQRAKGNIAFMTIDGLKGSTIDNIINQPIEGILYDLNRDYATIITLAKNSKNLRWINDLALSDLFKEIFKRYKNLEEENKLLREQISNSSKITIETNNKNIEEPIVEDIPETKKHNGFGAYKEGFDTSVVFQI